MADAYWRAPTEAKPRGDGHPFQPGQLVRRRYEIRRLLGEGSTGLVFGAIDLVSGEPVAVKTLRKRYIGSGNVLARFGREALVLSQLRHPNIVRYLDHGIDGTTIPFLVLEYIRGTPGDALVERAAQGKLKATQTRHTLKQLFEAVAYLHGFGIIHRDLKWSNLVITPQPDDALHITLIDLGVLKYAQQAMRLDDRKLTATGVMVGTAEYASPEQVRCLTDLDQRADIYALGIMTYVLVAGRLPFQGANAIETAMAQVRQAPVAPHDVPGRGHIPRALSAAILRAMHKDRQHRFSSVAHFWRTLDVGLRQLPDV